MGLPKVYLNRTPSTLANYNFTDVASGQAFIKLYAGTSQTADEGKLISFPFYSNAMDIESADQGSTFGDKSVQTQIFYSDIIKPLRIRGEVVFNGAQGLRKHTTWAGTSSCSSYLVVTLSKVSGGVTTQICTGTSTNLSFTLVNTTTTKFREMMVKMSIASMVSFKAGDRIKLSVEQRGTATSNQGETYFYLAHDPQNSSSGWTYADVESVTWTSPTIMSISIPAVVDL